MTINRHVVFKGAAGRHGGAVVAVATLESDDEIFRCAGCYSVHGLRPSSAMSGQPVAQLMEDI